jgi:adenylate cyclase
MRGSSFVAPLLFEQALLLSASFTAAAGSAKSQFVSVGRYALRGVSTPQELFTLDPTGSG